MITQVFFRGAARYPFLRETQKGMQSVRPFEVMGGESGQRAKHDTRYLYSVGYRCGIPRLLHLYIISTYIYIYIYIHARSIYPVHIHKYIYINYTILCSMYKYEQQKTCVHDDGKLSFVATRFQEPLATQGPVSVHPEPIERIGVVV